MSCCIVSICHGYSTFSAKLNSSAVTSREVSPG